MVENADPSLSFARSQLFSLREDGLGMKDTAQRVFEAEIEVKGIAAGHQFDETKEELQVSPPPLVLRSSVVLTIFSIS